MQCQLQMGCAWANCFWIWPSGVFFLFWETGWFCACGIFRVLTKPPPLAILPACLRCCSLEMRFFPFKAFDVFSHVRKFKKAACEAGWGQRVLLGAAALILGGSFAINLIMHSSSFALCVRVCVCVCALQGVQALILKLHSAQA